MEHITIPKKKRSSSNLNALYGLEYRVLSVKREDIKKLEGLKAETGQPLTVLVGMAIDHFLKSATPESQKK